MTKQRDKKIKVLFVYANTTELGGADYCLFKLATTLDKRYFEVHVALGMPCNLADDYAKWDVLVHDVPMPRLQRTRNPLQILGYILGFIHAVFALVNLIRAFDIDIVHGNDLLDFLASIAARLCRIKAVQHVRLTLPSGILKTILTMLVWFLNHAIVAVSNACAQSMFGRYKDMDSKVITIYDWLDPERVGQTMSANNFRSEMGIGNDTLLIGIVGRLQELKGQHVFLKAASLLGSTKDFDPKFVICGGDVKGREDYSIFLRRFAKKLGLMDRVIFTGHRDDIINIVSSLDIFVLASITADSLPGVVMEAGYCGVPVVASNVGGVCEEVIDGETGFLYPPGDSSVLALRIHELIVMGKERRQLMGSLGRKYVLETFGRDKLIIRFENAYKSLLS